MELAMRTSALEHRFFLKELQVLHVWPVNFRVEKVLRLSRAARLTGWGQTTFERCVKH